jgi:hypothetical protein
VNTAAIVTALNDLLDDAGASSNGASVDTPAELQAFANKAIAVLQIAAYADADGVGVSVPNHSSYTSAGLKYQNNPIPSNLVPALNELFASVPVASGAASSLSAQQAIIDQASARLTAILKIAAYGQDNGLNLGANPAPTFSDYQAAGFAQVTSATIATAINAVIGTAGSSTNSLALDTVQEIQAFVDKATPPSVVFPVDNGTLTNDGVTSLEQVTVGNLAGLPWQFSLDAGQTWQAGTGTSFELPEDRYAINDIRIRKVIETGSLFSALGTNTSVIEVADIALAVRPTASGSPADDVPLLTYDALDVGTFYEVELWVDGQYVGSQSDLNESANGQVGFAVDLTGFYDLGTVGQFEFQAKLVNYDTAAERTTGLSVSATNQEIDYVNTYIYQ